MRILAFIHEYPPVGGGGGRVAQDIYEGLVARGHEIVVLTARYSDLPAEEDKNGVRIIRIPSMRSHSYWASFTAMAAYVVRSSACGWKFIRDWQPDLMHVHFAVPAGASAWFLYLTQHIPYVLTAHLGDVPGGVPEKTERWFRWVYPFTPPIWRSAEKVVAVSQYTRRLALEHYAVQIDVIPNGVDTKALDPGKINPGDPPNIVFAGRFVSQKNPLQIVRVLADLKDLPWTCTLLGDGPLRKQVEEEIRQHGLEGRLLLSGWITPEEVIEYLSRSDILFMPSLSEGLSVVGVQALSMGLAFVVSPAGGFVDIVEPGVNGFLIDSDDRNGYCNALKSLLLSSEQLLSFRQASRHKSFEFDLKNVVNAYEKIFLEVGMRDESV
jgi:L-malate glycosyltransferase